MELMQENITIDDVVNPCPICGKVDRLMITERIDFDQMRSYGGFLMRMECDRCGLELWSHNCDEKEYGPHRRWLIRQWNRMTGGDRDEVSETADDD